MTLNRKIIIITASILFVSLLTGSIVNIIYFKKNYTEALITGSYGLGSSLNSVVSELLNLGLPLDSLSGLNKKCEQIVKQNPHIRYAGITNLEGKTLYHSDQSIIGRVFTDEVAMRSVKTTKPLTQIYRRFDGNVYYDLTLPIFDSQNTHVGVIRLGFPKEFIDEKVTKAILQVILNFSISFVVIIILLNYFMSKFITNRLVELLNQTKKIMDGNYEETIPVSQNDEIGYLTESFNQMSKTIKNQMESIEAAKDELERKVIERTKELAETNKNLQNELIQREKIEKALLIAKQEAEAATIAKSEFLANMSHEIRTPLNAVIGLTGLALKTELTPKQRDYLKKIQSGSNTLLRLINDILDFSKIESGKLDIEQTGFYLSDVLNNISNLLSDSAAIKGIEFHIHKSRNVPNSLIGDPFRLEQVLINLTTNAIKFTEKGEVVLSVNLANNIESSLKEKSYQSKQAQKHVTINFSIKDTGIGITEEQRQRLFKPFMQADGSTTRKYGGSGLGLMISKSIVEAMGGEIGFHSEYGKGSTFFFNLKFDVQEDKAFYKKTLTLHHSFKGLRVLVVDDSATSREIMKDILESFGFVVDTANSGIEGIEKLKLSFLENPYSMVFLDWKMSGMDGINAAMKIRSESDLEKLSIIIMTTAYDMKNITDEAKRLNINGFITKPFEESMIFNTIMEVMGTEGFTLTKKEQVVENIALYKTHLLGSHVLLAEDSPLNQQVAEELLEMVGIKVDIAGDGEKAIKMAVDALNSKDQYRYDCILMDNRCLKWMVLKQPVG
ncbi:MAG: ATP-binding protein [Syntrophorhabdaceae bacterium]|nr:ATP-binding protein [Syntrophorhabdaceae bacterium]